MGMRTATPREFENSLKLGNLRILYLSHVLFIHWGVDSVGAECFEFPEDSGH
jgi:hypothetical protein